MSLTPAMEDYLEAILMIKQQHGYVRCVDVAEQLGVKKPSVSRAVKELIKSGHLVKNADGTLSLTELGLQIAEQIYEKHLFFTKQLILAGVDPETAEQDACGIEHAVSSESFQKLKKAFDDGYVVVIWEISRVGFRGFWQTNRQKTAFPAFPESKEGVGSICS